MKRCPHCHRAEADDALTFCRVDGTPLVRESGAVSEDAGTLKFDSAPASNETETRILPPAGATTDEAQSRTTAPTTVLDPQRTAGGTPELSKLKAKRAGVIIAALALALILAGFAYYSLSRKDTTAIDSVAVLPFVNASGDPNLEYLSDGVTESLINSLSQLPDLAVKARSTVFRYKGKETDPQKVGSELNVQAVLSGRMAQRGDGLSFSLELVDTRTGNQLWGEQYNRKLTDLVALQSDIARDVSNKLRIKPSGADEGRVAKSYTGNPEAYRLYLLGRFYWNKRTAKDLHKAAEYFRQAVALDLNYALAYSGLADAYTLLPIYGGAPPSEVLPKAREAALKALSLDNQLAEAHISLGLVLHFYDYDSAGAEREFKAAIELNPNNATAHQFYGNLLFQLGRDKESSAEFRRALEIDPLLLTSNRLYALSLLYARKYDEAIAQLKKTVELDASFAPAHDSLAQVYLAKGNYAESVEEFAKEQELIGEPQNAVLIRESFARGGWQGFLRAMTGESRPSNLASYRAATFHAALGEKDKAFAELNKAYENREFFMMLVKVDPRLDSLRTDPRFTELMHKVGLPQ